MEDSIDDLKRQIDSCVKSGGISDSDIKKLRASASRIGVSPAELNSMVSQRLGIEASDIGFQPRWYHLVLAVLVIASMSLFVFVSINFDSDGEDVARESVTSLRNMPVSPGDLVHSYSGNYEGTSVFLKIISATDNGNGTCDVVFDVKCDFIPVAQSVSGVFNLDNRTFDLGAQESVLRKVPLDKGTIERTISGKLVLKPYGGAFELVQL